jgi:HD-like signal output (HDOD) protein
MVYNEGKSYLESEETILDFTHCELGAYLVKEWNFPIEFGKVIYYHHRLNEIDPDGMDPVQIKFIALVNVANQIMHKLGIGYRDPDEDLDLTQLQALQFLGVALEDESVGPLLAKVADSYQTERSKFN